MPALIFENLDRFEKPYKYINETIFLLYLTATPKKHEISLNLHLILQRIKLLQKQLVKFSQEFLEVRWNPSVLVGHVDLVVPMDLACLVWLADLGLT